MPRDDLFYDIGLPELSMFRYGAGRGATRRSVIILETRGWASISSSHGIVRLWGSMMLSCFGPSNNVQLVNSVELLEVILGLISKRILLGGSDGRTRMPR